MCFSCYCILKVSSYRQGGPYRLSGVSLRLAASQSRLVQAMSRDGKATLLLLCYPSSQIEIAFSHSRLVQKIGEYRQDRTRKDWFGRAVEFDLGDLENWMCFRCKKKARWNVLWSKTRSHPTTCKPVNLCLTKASILVVEGSCWQAHEANNGLRSVCSANRRLRCVWLDTPATRITNLVDEWTHPDLVGLSRRRSEVLGTRRWRRMRQDPIRILGRNRVRDKQARHQGTDAQHRMLGRYWTHVRPRAGTPFFLARLLPESYGPYERHKDELPPENRTVTEATI